MVIAWLVTLPAAGLAGAVAHYGIQGFSSDTSGVLVVGVVALGLVGFLIWHARLDNVTSRNVVPPKPAVAGAIRAEAGASA
jgi:hypothetical protein